MNGYSNGETWSAATYLLNEPYFHEKAFEAVRHLDPNDCLSPDAPEGIEEAVDELRALVEEVFEENNEDLEDVSRVDWSDLIDTLLG